MVKFKGALAAIAALSSTLFMEAALTQAGKPVEFMRLSGEDHWLSSSDTQLATLRASAEFIEQHIGSTAAAAPK